MNACSCGFMRGAGGGLCALEPWLHSENGGCLEVSALSEEMQRLGLRFSPGRQQGGDLALSASSDWSRSSSGVFKPSQASNVGSGFSLLVSLL